MTAAFPEFTAHPAAELFPMLPEKELAALAADIKANGQRVPIAIMNGCEILDGRNRYAACRIAGVTPWTKEMQSEFGDESEVIRFIVSTNIHRRHLSESQRAMIASELAKLGLGANQHREGTSIDGPSMTQAQAAEAMQVGIASVQRARQVQEQAPDLAAKVKAGEMKVSKAASIARERTKPQTNPDLADDSVIDATEKRHAEGDTPRSRSALATIAKLDETELSFIRPDLLKMLGITTKETA